MSFLLDFPPMEKLARTHLHTDFGRRRVAVRLILALHRKRPGTEPGAGQPSDVSRIAHRILPGHDAAPVHPPFLPSVFFESGRAMLTKRPCRLFGQLLGRQIADGQRRA
jgi:hypothetical protein